LQKSASIQPRWSPTKFGLPAPDPSPVVQMNNQWLRSPPRLRLGALPVRSWADRQAPSTGCCRFPLLCARRTLAFRISGRFWPSRHLLLSQDSADDVLCTSVNKWKNCLSGCWNLTRIALF